MAYRMFARAAGVDLDEVELELHDYPTFSEFFVRKLRPGARPLEGAPDAVVSPCDGLVAVAGRSDGGTLIQAKGRTYTLGELVADEALAARLQGGAYTTIYLSPRDYHRVHTPVSGTVVKYDYLPGALWSVKPWVVERRDRLLARNERVVIHIDAGKLGMVAVVMVGAGGVGNMRLGPTLETAEWRGAAERRITEVSIPVEKGDELGAFLLGSTVVMAFEAKGVRDLALEPGEHVRVGQGIGKVTA